MLGSYNLKSINTLTYLLLKNITAKTKATTMTITPTEAPMAAAGLLLSSLLSAGILMVLFCPLVVVISGIRVVVAGGANNDSV